MNHFVFVCPHASSELHVHGAPPPLATVLVRRRPKTTITDVTIADQSGAVLVSIAGMAFEELESCGRGWPADDTSRMVHQVAWHPLPDGHREPPSGVVLVGGDGDGVDCAIRDLVAAGVPLPGVRGPW